MSTVRQATQHDYTQVDAALLLTIRGGRTAFSKIFRQVEETVKLTGLKNLERVVDRRLQALRKQGKIGFNAKKGGWHPTNPETPK